MDTEAAQRPEAPPAGPMGPGRLVLVVGPSGAGKDTLMAGARAILRADTSFVFARRVVTRPEGAHEEHDTLSENAFQEARSHGQFVLHWQAHGLSYGVPASIADDIRCGRTVVVNTSRRIADQARACFAHVAVLLVTAPSGVLDARITARGRDAPEGSRSDPKRADDFVPDATIVNDGAPEAGVAQMVAFLSRL